MNTVLTYIDAVTEDHLLLTATAIASKKIWGYSEDLIELWRTDLEVSKEYIPKNKVVKVYEQEIFIGFFAVKISEGNLAEIDHLWLLPGRIHQGFGKLIFQHIIHYLKSTGHKSATLIAEPNATGFYNKMNGKVIGQFQSKISGRFLDIYEFNI
jgi:GNAT superfamily N-acetyltransferase